MSATTTRAGLSQQWAELAQAHLANAARALNFSARAARQRKQAINSARILTLAAARAVAKVLGGMR